MNAICPECGSIFRVDPAKVPLGGVRARCSVCGGVIAIGDSGSAFGGLAGAAMSGLGGGQAATRAAAAMPSMPPRYSGGASTMPAAPPQAPARVAAFDLPGLGTPRPAAAPAAWPAAPVAPPPAAPSFGGIPAMPAAMPTTQPRPLAPRPVAPPLPPPKSPAVTQPMAQPLAPAAAAPVMPMPMPTLPQAPPTRRPAPAAQPMRVPDAAPTQRTSAPAQRPSAAIPGTRPPINPFLQSDPDQKAKRLARALVSDIVAYFPEKHQEGLRNGSLRELFREEIKKSYEEYMDQVGKEFSDRTTHFQDALNDVLAQGTKVF